MHRPLWINVPGKEYPFDALPSRIVLQDRLARAHQRAFDKLKADSPLGRVRAFDACWRAFCWAQVRCVAMAGPVEKTLDQTRQIIEAGGWVGEPDEESRSADPANEEQAVRTVWRHDEIPGATARARALPDVNGPVSEFGISLVLPQELAPMLATALKDPFFVETFSSSYGRSESNDAFRVAGTFTFGGRDHSHTRMKGLVLFAGAYQSDDEPHRVFASLDHSCVMI